MFEWAVSVPDGVRPKEDIRLWKWGLKEVLRGSECGIFFWGSVSVHI